jgi:hypothetical protein
VEHQYSVQEHQDGSRSKWNIRIQYAGAANIDLVEVQEQADHQGQGNIRVKEVQEHQDSVEGSSGLADRGTSGSILVVEGKHQDLAEVQDHQI